MQNRSNEVLVRMSKAEWAALCFFAANAISGVQPFNKQEPRKTDWTPLARTAMAALERASK